MARGSFGTADMTQGTPWKRIVAFTLPMLIGNIAQQLYNTVDSIVVGKYIGDNALAAVGSAGPIVNLLLVLFIQKTRDCICSPLFFLIFFIRLRCSFRLLQLAFLLLLRGQLRWLHDP